MPMNQTSKFRLMSIAPSTRGFGYAVLEEQNSLVIYGCKTMRIGKRYKNVGCIALIKKMIVQYRPDVLVLYDINAKGIRRQTRIKELHHLIVKLARQGKLKTSRISGIDARQAILGEPKGTKHDMAELLAKRFPDQLASRLPPKRKCGHTEDGRMDWPWLCEMKRSKKNQPYFCLRSCLSAC